MENRPVVNGGGVENEGGPAAEEEEEEGLVSFKEYVEGLEAQELEVDMILGGDEGKDCTYPKGYLPRQAVFSCITCCPEGNAGVCTACSMTCHDGHEVVELWTRRRFRCDCGNSKFGIGICRLFSSKDTENSENVYNQNFMGVYCTCKRPYPDPDGGEDLGEMLQCCVCEDWFHELHLGLALEEEVPRDEDGEPLFDELMCQACAASLDFLSCYNELLVPVAGIGTTHTENGFTEKDGMTTNLGHAVSEGIASSSKGTSSSQEVGSLGNENKLNTSAVALDAYQAHQADILDMEPSAIPPLDIMNSKDVVELGGKLENDGVADSKMTYLASQDQSGVLVCKLNLGETSGGVPRGEAVQGEDTNINGDDQAAVAKGWTGKALFLLKNWRSQLCRCGACCQMYVGKGVSFLLDSEDTLSKYEETAKQKRKEKMEATDGQNLSFLNSLSHVGQIEFLHGLNDMTNELSAFFASCETGKAITSADIYEFFDNLRRKRARLT